MSNEFYLRYYVGHKGKFGHEFLEFEFRPDGKICLIFIVFNFFSCIAHLLPFIKTAEVFATYLLM